MYEVMWKGACGKRNVHGYESWNSHCVDSLVFKGQVFPSSFLGNFTYLVCFGVFVCLFVCFQTPIQYLMIAASGLILASPGPWLFLMLYFPSWDSACWHQIWNWKAPWLPSSTRPSLACATLFISWIAGYRLCHLIECSWNHSPMMNFNLCDSSFMKLRRKFFGARLFFCLLQKASWYCVLFMAAVQRHTLGELSDTS